MKIMLTDAVMDIDLVATRCKRAFRPRYSMHLPQPLPEYHRQLRVILGFHISIRHLIRYITAGGITVVGIPFYCNMGVHWTLTILDGINALLVPVPYLFYIYRKKIRAKGKYAAFRD